MYTPAQIQAVRRSLAQYGIGPQDFPGVLDVLSKAATFSAPSSPTTGFAVYNLELLAKMLVTSYTPIRKKFPRVPGKGVGPNWRALTKIDTDRRPMGVPEGVRGALLKHTEQDFTGRYAIFNAATSETEFAVLAAQGFDDLRAIAQIAGLYSVFNMEERQILGGLGTYGLGTANTVTASASTLAAGSGSLSAGTTYHVRVVALTMDGYRISVPPGATAAGQVPTVLVMTSASPRATTYNVNGGASQISADATGTTAGSGAGLTALDCSCTFTAGAVAYAWFIGSSASNGTCSAITTVNKVTLTSVKTGGSPPSGFADTVSTNFNTDQSQNTLVFDGILPILAKSGSGATITTLDGATLTSDGAGGIKEFDAILQSIATSNLVAPKDIWFNLAHASDIANKISAGGTGDKTFHIIIPMGSEQANLQGGVVATGYKNKFAFSDADRAITLHTHPDVPPGTFIFGSDQLPQATYPLSNIPGVAEMELLQEYQQREYAMIDPLYETSVGFIGVLKMYFPPAYAALQNVAIG